MNDMKFFKKITMGLILFALVLMLAAPQVMAAYHVKKIETRMPALVTAGETLTTGQLVCIKDSDGKAYKADGNDSALWPAVGVVGKGASSGGYVEIITRGKLSGWSSLSEGLPGYLSDTAAAVSQTASTTYQQQVAIAVSTTEYMFDFSAKMDAELLALAGLTSAANKIPYFTGSGSADLVSSSANMISLLASADYSTARTNLGVAIGSDVQAYDADLAALAGLTSAANTFPYFTGTGTAGAITSSANIISWLASADYSTARTNLGVAIDSDVQSYDADTAALAGVTSAANAIPYFTGSGAADVISSSANMISLLGSADYSTARTNLGVAIGSDVQAYSAEVTYTHRHRVTVAEINAGHELLPAITGKSYRVIQCLAIAYGGAVGTTTTVDLLGTQAAGSVKLVAYGQANLTQSAVLVSGGTGATVQADGASYAACDANTAITIGKTGGDADTATGVDIILTYVIE